MKLLPLVVAAALCSGELSAQQSKPDTLIVMTVPLKFISAATATTLLAPYATTGATEGHAAGGVFPVPGDRAITIREKVAQYGRMLGILREYDRPPREIEYAYQLIMADDSGRRASEIASLDSVLRTSLKYTGFKLLGSGSVTGHGSGSESGIVWLDDARYTIDFRMYDGPVTTPGASTRISVVAARENLTGGQSDGMPRGVFGADNVTIPIGQTVVLAKKELDRNHALILTVRPTLSTPGTKTKDE